MFVAYYGNSIAGCPCAKVTTVRLSVYHPPLPSDYISTSATFLHFVYFKLSQGLFRIGLMSGNKLSVRLKFGRLIAGIKLLKFCPTVSLKRILSCACNRRRLILGEADHVNSSPAMSDNIF